MKRLLLICVMLGCAEAPDAGYRNVEDRPGPADDDDCDRLAKPPGPCPKKIAEETSAPSIPTNDSGGTCTGTHDVCHPVACTYTVTPLGAELRCQHNRQQDQVCNSICLDRGGGSCGDAADFEVIACVNSCAGSSNRLLCQGLCYNAMRGYCEPLEPLTDPDQQ